MTDKQVAELMGIAKANEWAIIELRAQVAELAEAVRDLRSGAEGQPRSA